jgi:hypothetical protein
MSRVREWADLEIRLRARQPEIEAEILTRLVAIEDPAEVMDPAYEKGLTTALEAALEYGFASLERGEEPVPPVPLPALGQARLAARNGVSLDRVLRRYFAGYTVLAHYLAKEAEDGELGGGAVLSHLLRLQAETFEHLIAAVSREYERASREDRRETASRRRRRLIEELLAGQRSEAVELRYGLDTWHLGLISTGSSAGEAVVSIARSLAASLLLVEQEGGTVWAWLGGGRVLERDHFELAQHLRSSSGVLAAGEPARGLAGWRLTHRQAAAALAVGRQTAAPLVRYRDVALLAAAQRDELLRSSLEQVYLVPLSADREGGAALRLTLEAYFHAGHNAASAAAALGVSRQTVNSRLRSAEERLGCPLESCAADLQTALRLRSLSKLSSKLST